MAAIIAGAGESTGLALARKFAAQGPAVHGARRRPPSRGEEEKNIAMHAVDFRDENAVENFVQKVGEISGPVSLAVHNIGANVHYQNADTTPRVYRKTWELAALSAFNFARSLGPRMAARGEGTLIFTGATASVRGASHFSAFSAGMAGKRALSQSLASELGPKGVHVAHVVVDGAIETPFVRGLMGDDAFEAAKAAGGLLAPEAIADTYLHLHQQPRTAWTHELDLRPASEAPWWSPRAKI